MVRLFHPEISGVIVFLPAYDWFLGPPCTPELIFFFACKTSGSLLNSRLNGPHVDDGPPLWQQMSTLMLGLAEVLP